jgi:hypothetical protein
VVSIRLSGMRGKMRWDMTGGEGKRGEGKGGWYTSRHVRRLELWDERGCDGEFFSRRFCRWRL